MTKKDRPNSKFYTAKGELTPYALACGYLQEKQQGDVQITLWYEPCAYHVRAHSLERGRIFWDTYRTLTEARQRYRKWQIMEV